MLFTVVQPPRALQEGTKTAPDRHQQIKSLFRHPFCRKNVQTKLQKSSIWVPFFSQKQPEIHIGRCVCLRGAQSTSEPVKSEPQALRNRWFGELLHYISNHLARYCRAQAEHPLCIETAETQANQKSYPSAQTHRGAAVSRQRSQ